MKHWLLERVFYEIYTPSFFDANNDGKGDIPGIIQKLDYLVSMGIGAIWLTPFYRSPKVDNGYDISDYMSVDPEYGSTDDIIALIREAHKRNIKVVIDMVLNHTSDQHPWFLQSRLSKDNPKRNWYIWKDATGSSLPNNWESFFGGSAWEYDQKTDSYYYHAFSKSQVDLNWAYPLVRSAMYDILKYWLEMGIDGFRLDVINFLKTGTEFPDNPYDNSRVKQIHRFDKDQEGVKQVLKEIRSICKAYGDILLLGEIGNDSLDEIMNYVGDDYLDAALNFNLGSIQTFDCSKIGREFLTMETKYPELTKTYFFSSHDMRRHISRFCRPGYELDIARLVAVFLLTVRGIPILYYGEELGMQDLVAQSVQDLRDIQAIKKYNECVANGMTEEESLRVIVPYNRDASRSPMQWDGIVAAGFTRSIPWIGLSPTYKERNVTKESADSESLLQFYRQLILLRNSNKSLQQGTYSKLTVKGWGILFEREWRTEHVTVILNFTDKSIVLDSDCIKLNRPFISSLGPGYNRQHMMGLHPYEACIGFS